MAGGFKSEIQAARAHDLVSIKIWGIYARTNFMVSMYSKEILEMKSMNRRELILSLRRSAKKTGSDYFGVSRNVKIDKWEARLEKGNGMPALYLGTFDTEEAAARAYDAAARRWRGEDAVTNFGLSDDDNSDNMESTETLPNEAGVVSGSQTVDDAHNEANHDPNTDSPQQKSSNSQDQPNNQLLVQHDVMITSSPFGDHQNHDLIQVSEGGNGIEGNNTISDCGATFPDHDESTMEQSVLLGTGQEPQAVPPQVVENIVNGFCDENFFDNQFLYQSPTFPFLHDDYYQGLMFQDDNNLGFQNDDFSLPLWSFDFGIPIDQGNPQILSSNGNAPNVGISSSQGYGMNYQVPDQSLSSYNFPNDPQNTCFETNNGFEVEKAGTTPNDFDVNQYINNSYMEDEKMEADMHVGF